MSRDSTRHDKAVGRAAAALAALSLTVLGAVNLVTGTALLGIAQIVASAGLAMVVRRRSSEH